MAKPRRTAGEFDRLLQESLRRGGPRRALDQEARESWQGWAAKALPRLSLTLGKHGHRVCTLEQDGQIVGTWVHDDVPWLHGWLSEWLPVLHGAWHVAQPALRIAAGRKEAGKKTGRETTRSARERGEKIAVEAAKLGAHNKIERARILADRDSSLGKPGTIVKRLPRKKS